MLAHLAEAAAESGSAVHGRVLPENHRMIDVFRESGFDRRSRAARRLHVTMPTG